MSRRTRRQRRTSEPAGLRWRRRALSIPAMLGATVLAFAAAPLAVPALAVSDLLIGRRRLPRARMYGMLLQYVFNDSVEVALAPWYWVLAGFGTRLDSRASLRRHARLQRWSGDRLARRAEQLVGLRIELIDGEPSGPAPVIVLARHVNVADASLPGLLYARHTAYDIRGVIMRELLTDPGFDLIYGRLGSVFIDRDGGEGARAEIRALGEDLDERTAAVIFPEGRLFRPDRLDRALGRLAETAPARAARLEGLRHVLPPQPGGVLALLAGAPDADVAVVTHTGFESLPSLAELCRRAPVDHPIRVSVRRIARKDVPAAKDAQARWLDDQWLAMDDWIDATLRDQTPAGAAESRLAEAV